MKAFWMASIAAWVMGGCAVAPQSDGGIVGTGNRPDCEQAKEGSVRPATGECKQDEATPSRRKASSSP
jgi:hypothetical protein